MVEQIDNRNNGYRHEGNAEALLYSLMVAQSADFSPIATDSRKHLLADFKKTDIFRARYLELIRRMCLPLGKEESVGVRQDFSGAIFQDMAFMYLAQSQPSSLTLISPERTLKLYKWLYPHAHEARHKFGLNSLQGISVPDGILVGDDGKIAAICEYKLHGSPLEIQKQIDGMERVKRNFGNIFSEAKLIVVRPEGYTQTSTKFSLLTTPFSHAQFRDFIDGIYESYRPDAESATVDEIQEWAWEQRRKIEAQHSLTPQARRYLQKVSAQGR